MKQSVQIQFQDALADQGFGNVAVGNSVCDACGNQVANHLGIRQHDGVVPGGPTEDLNGAINFVFSVD